MDKGEAVKAIIWFCIAIPILYFAACSYVSASKSKAYESINIGDSEEDVVRILGRPSVREKPDAQFTRYSSNPCRGECRQRLWFENRLSFDTEAWSIELDSSKRVIYKARWHSP